MCVCVCALKKVTAAQRQSVLSCMWVGNSGLKSSDPRVDIDSVSYRISVFGLVTWVSGSQLPYKVETSIGKRLGGFWLKASHTVKTSKLPSLGFPGPSGSGFPKSNIQQHSAASIHLKIGL